MLKAKSNSTPRPCALSHQIQRPLDVVVAEEVSSRIRVWCMVRAGQPLVWNLSTNHPSEISPTYECGFNNTTVKHIDKLGLGFKLSSTKYSQHPTTGEYRVNKIPERWCKLREKKALGDHYPRSSSSSREPSRKQLCNQASHGPSRADEGYLCLISSDFSHNKNKGALSLQIY